VLRAEALDASGHARDAVEASFAFAPPTPKAASTPVAEAPYAAKPAELALPVELKPMELTVAAAEPSRSKEPTPAAIAAPTAAPTNEQSSAAPSRAVDVSRAVAAEVHTTMVVSGDNLWDLARKFYGDGLRYANIYSANSNQIRNPNLIFIGQVFVVPQNPPAIH